jgi:AAA domain
MDKARPDANDTLRDEGPEGVRRRHDRARKFNGADTPTQGEQPTFTPTPFAWRDPKEIKRRDWLYGKHYIRKNVSCTIGRRGGGKTTRAITEILSRVTGRDLLNVGAANMPARPTREWYVGEDTREEIERRIMAVCLHYEITAEEIGDRLFFDSVLDLSRGATKVALVKGASVVSNERAINSFKAGIRSRKIDILTLDPLKKFHGVKENDNDQMDEVMSILFEIAAELDMSIEILHHTRKPSSGNSGQPMTVDDGRGADAIIAGSRSARIVNGLSPKDAPSLGIKEDDAWRYTRLDSGKANMAPPEAAIWARSASVVLPCGESVGVLESWKTPDTFEGMSIADITFIRELAQTGAYRADSRAETGWIGEPLAERLGLNPTDKKDRARLNKIIKKWLKTRVLDIRERRDEESRKMRNYVVPGKWQPVDPECATL